MRGGGEPCRGGRGLGGRGGEEEIKSQELPKATAGGLFVRGGEGGREKSSANTCLFLTSNKSASSSHPSAALCPSEEEEGGSLHHLWGGGHEGEAKRRQVERADVELR